MALKSGSPAIGAGTSIAGITTDQRGDPLDSPPDIGAYQTQSTNRVPLSFTLSAGPSITYGTPSVTLSGVLSNGEPIPPWQRR